MDKPISTPTERVTEVQQEFVERVETDEMELLIHNIIRDVAELPDRNSPDNWPEAMLVTDKELGDILRDRLAAIAPSPAPARQEIYSILAAMVADTAFEELCQGIGEEPEWMKRARLVLKAEATQ